MAPASPLTLKAMDATSYRDIKSALRQLYLDDPRPWLVGFGGGKNSTMLGSLDSSHDRLYASGPDGEYPSINE
jgi:hypothetical protein